MEFLRPDQIIPLAVFLAVLVAVWVYVLRNRESLSARMGRGRRLRVVETAALGPSDRAMILSLDDQEFLIVKMKGAAPLLRSLGTAQGVEEVA
jgi:flagellar protein FliO/FliZ